MENHPPSVLYLSSGTGDQTLADAIRRRGWDVREVADPEQAIGILDGLDCQVGLVQLEGWAGDALHEHAERLFGLDPAIKWIALTPRRSPMPPAMCRLLAEWFHDYHTAPADVDRLVATLGHALGMARLTSKVRRLSEDASEDLPADLRIVGRSPAMRTLRRQLRKVAASDFSVLIRGESGTGKELVAQAIHRLSGRAERPFIAVNCGALPRELIQSELFGHEKGAFTGADQRRIGCIEAAQGGTLFLDEIGDLPLEMQVNLLRFLQERTIQRIGGSASIAVDVRVLAATHVQLEEATDRGDFREDLYYRLNVLHLDVPPLRERASDIELLAEYFLRKFSGSLRPNLRGFSRQAIAEMTSYPWPGNVRELLHRIQRAVVMCEGTQITARDLALERGGPNSPLASLAKTRAQAEKSAIEASLVAARNNVSKAARYLDISRVTLYRLMEQHGIDWQRRQPLSFASARGMSVPAAD